MYTKGNWYYDKGYIMVRPNDKQKHEIIAVGGTTIVDTEEEQQANGRLMAKAPEMLKQLRLLTEYLEDLIDPEDFRCLRIQLEETYKLLKQFDGE